jgi:pimeloyl-ACP methyl ester carboxylesterase
MPAYRERCLTAQDGLSLYYRDYGDPLSPRTPVLCLAGLTRNSADFDEVARHLAPARRVLAPDYRGRGRSAYDRDWHHYEPLTYLNDATHLLAANDIHKVVVIGTSLGGLLAMGLGVLHPTMLAGAVLNDIGPEMIPGGLQRIYDYIGADRPQPDWPAAIRFLRETLPRLAPRADDTWWRKLAETTYRQGEDGLLHFDWDIRLAKGLAQQQAMVPALWPLYRGLARVPTLAIRGALSDVLSAAAFDRMAEEKPDLMRVTVPDRGHTPSLGEPEAVAALDAFFARI